jgi:chemotaxis methyl-accepting protein methylase
LDLLEDVPNEFLGRFDLVHVILLVMVLNESNTPSIVQKLMKMLKPGGYLQWDELDGVNMHMKKVSPWTKSARCHMQMAGTIGGSNFRTS